MSGKTYFEGGQWNAACFRCGWKFKSGELRKTWQGFWACDRCWEPRQPQDFARSVLDNPGVPWAQNDNWVFGGMCTPDGITAIADGAVADCAIAGYISPSYLVPAAVVIAGTCTSTTTSAVAGYGVSGCMVSGFLYESA